MKQLGFIIYKDAKIYVGTTSTDIVLLVIYLWSLKMSSMELILYFFV